MTVPLVDGDVFTEVRRWQQGRSTADAVVAVALSKALGDESAARALMAAAVASWETVLRLSAIRYRDINGAPYQRSA